MTNIAFFKPLMDETMSLLIEARYYVSEKASKEAKQLPVDKGLTASMESMRVVSRLTQVMAWILTQRAVVSGEITSEEALTAERRLGGQDICLIDTASYDEALPKELRHLLQRSFALYQRVARMDQMAEKRAQNKFAPSLSG